MNIRLNIYDLRNIFISIGQKKDRAAQTVLMRLMIKHQRDTSR